MEFKEPSNNQLKKWRKLLQGKYRKQENQFLAEGLRCVEQIIQQKKVTVTEVLVEINSEVIGALSIKDIPVYELGQSDFESVSDTETPQGIIAVCNTPVESDLEKLSKKEGLIVAFDAIQDPGNLGTMIRTSSWFEASGLLIGHGTVDPFHPKVVRSTAGATGAISYRKADLHSELLQLEESGWNISILDGSENAISLKSADKTGRDILVIGNEGNGVNPKLLQNRRAVKIPGNSHNVESLNAAIALSIALYQFSDS